MLKFYNKYENVIQPLISVFLGLLVGSIILLLTGKSPVLMFNALLKGLSGFDANREVYLNLRYFGEFLVFSMPIIMTGLSIGFAYRTGLFNIGAEGQLMIGGMIAVVIAILVPLPSLIHPVVALIAAFIFGGLWAAIAGFLKAKFNVHEVVVTIMLNYIALHVTNYVLLNLPGSDKARTADYLPSATLKSDFLTQITNGSRFNWGFIVVILAIILYWFLIEKTTFGYSLKATGFNKEGARFAGLKVNLNIVLSMFIAGGFAGLAGAIMALGTYNYGRIITSFENFGFDGIAVALVGSLNAIGILFSGLLFGLLRVAQPLMQSQLIPKDIAVIVSSSIVIFVAMQKGIKIFITKVLNRGVKS